LSSRDIPKQRRIVEVSIERQQTKIAAATTSRKTVENAFPKLARAHVEEVERGHVQRLEDLARRRAPQTEARVARGRVLDRNGRRCVLPDPGDRAGRTRCR
jgi:hypothetical protein